MSKEHYTTTESNLIRLLDEAGIDSESIVEELKALIAEGKFEPEPGTTYWIPDRAFHKVYRKGDGLIVWLKSKWWDWRCGR